MSTPITSLEDLTTRCAKASRKSNWSRTGYFEPNFYYEKLGFPPSEGVTNAQLRKLKPLYLEFLNNLSEMKENSECLVPLYRAQETPKKPDGAILLLHFMAYPTHMIYHRLRQVDGSFEQNEFEDIREALAKNIIVGGWCRTILRTAEKHHAFLLWCALRQMNSISLIQSTYACLDKQKDVEHTDRILKFYKKIDASSSDGKQALSGVASDLVKAMDSAPLNPDGMRVVKAALGCFSSIRKLFTEEEYSSMIMTLHATRTAKKALDRNRRGLGEAYYRGLSSNLVNASGESIEDLEQVLYGRSGVWRDVTLRGLALDCPVCEAEGCSKEGKKRCECKLASYCSRECQVEHWKEHKKICCKRKSKKKQPFT